MSMTVVPYANETATSNGSIIFTSWVSSRVKTMPVNGDAHRAAENCAHADQRPEPDPVVWQYQGLNPA